MSGKEVGLILLKVSWHQLQTSNSSAMTKGRFQRNVDGRNKKIDINRDDKKEEKKN